MFRPSIFLSPLLRCLAAASVCLASLFIPSALRAQVPATGTITGHVQNVVTGDYLNNARVSIKGTNQVALTDNSGYYQLSGVPAGAADLRVFFTGLDEQQLTVSVAAAQTLQQDFQLTSKARYGDNTGTIKLDEFVVASTKETNAQAIAVNEQRMALGQKRVVSADQFGTIPDSNPGELMKWLPGVSVEYFANNIVGVSVRGLDAVNTEIRFDGLPVASASTATLGTSSRDRNFEMLGSSSADIARVEIRLLRTPEDSANAIGGSINMVRRSAFEYNKRVLSYGALFTTDYESFSFSPRAGPRDTQIRGWRPNFKLTWTDPISKTFGYAVTVNHNDVLAQVHWSFPTVNFGTADQAAAAKARLAAGLPLTTVSPYNPQFRQEGLHDNPKQDISDNASVKFDWRPTHEFKVSYSLSGGRYQERAGDDVRVNWNTGTPSTSAADSVTSTALGQPGTNNQTSVYGNLGAGTYVYDLREAWRNGIKDTLTNAVETEWHHGDWTVHAAGSYSTSKHVFKDTDNGFFGSTTLTGSTLPNTGIGTGTASKQLITVNVLDRDFTNAHTIKTYAFTAGDTTVGKEINWQDLSNATIGGAVSRPGKTLENIAALRLWTKYNFRFANPFTVRVGFDYDDQFRNVQRYDANLYTFVGADHIAQTADDNAAQIAAVNIQPRRDAFYNFPAVPRLSMRQLYGLFVAHSDWFQYRDAESYRYSQVEPYEVEEKLTAPWIEFTGAFFHNRLTYVGGVRYEKDETSGIFALDHGSRYVTNLGLVDGTLAGNTARYVRKGSTGQGSEDGFYPSLEVNYNLTANLIFRAGYAKTRALNRYTRSIIPAAGSFASIDLNPVTSGAFANIAIGTVNRPNPGLKPWTGDNYEAHLEYYSPQGGVLSAGAYIKEIDNVQVQITQLLDTPAKLEDLDLPASYLNFQSATWVNQGKGEISGLEFDVRQPLDAWLPEIARGFTLTGSANTARLDKFGYLRGLAGNVGVDFQNFYQKQFKASVGYSRGKFTAHVGAIYNGKVFRQREDIAATATNPAIKGYRYYPPYTTLDFSVDYSLTRWAKLFLSGRNITDARKVRYRTVEGAPEWSQFQIANSLGVTYTAGVTGTF